MRYALLLSAVALVACAKSETPADTTAAAPAVTTPPPPAPLTPADVAGTWTVTGKNEAGDSTLVTYEMKATTDTTGWTITFPGRQPIPMRVVAVSGDSIVVEAGPFPSALRRGVQVRSSRGAFRMVDGKLVGSTTTRYNTKRPDSVATLRTEGTRKP
jgi:hypothetical protein